METMEFVEKYLRESGVRKRSITDIYSGWPRVFFQKLAKRTEEVEYHCDIHENGCANTRANGHSDFSGKCCCNKCYDKIGYYDELSLEDAELLAPFYKESKKHGFWRPGKGCVIPRHLRSVTCITYTCSFIKVSYRDSLLLRAIDRGPYRVLLPLTKHAGQVPVTVARFLCHEILHMHAGAQGIYSISSDKVFEHMGSGLTSVALCISERKKNSGLCTIELTDVDVDRAIKSEFPSTIWSFAQDSAKKKCEESRCPLLAEFKCYHHILGEYLDRLYSRFESKEAFANWLRPFINYHLNWGTPDEFPYPLEGGK